MAEELQNLLERIQKEGVDRADAEADRITAEAGTKAKAILVDAQKEADSLLEKAKADSELFTQRSESAIGQAARDLILSVGDAITETLQTIVARKVDHAMSAEALPALIKEALAAYSTGASDGNLEVILNDKQQASLQAFFMKELADAMRNGLTVRSSRNIISGFRVSLKDTGVQHDFTGEALTAAISQLLRPQLAAIVQNALKKMEPALAQ